MSALDAHEGLTEKEREMVELSDADLVQRFYDEIGDLVGNSFDDREADRFYWLLAEVVERFAPAVGWADRVRSVHESDLSDPHGELEASIERMQRRFAARLQFASFREEARDDA